MRVLDPIKNFLRPGYHRLKKEPYFSLHWLHSKIVDRIFGQPEMYKILGQIPKTLIRQLLEVSQKGGVQFEPESCKTRDNLLINQLSPQQIRRLNEDVEVLTIPRDFGRIILNSIFKSVRAYSKSPLVVCNFRAWITRPGAPRRGPNEMHTDGFYPGHFKVMLYLNGLNRASGMLCIGNELVTDKEEGTVIGFRNSDIPHSGIPGEMEERAVIEVTFIRTFLTDISVFKREFNGRHFNSLYKLYREILPRRIVAYAQQVVFGKLAPSIVVGKTIITSIFSRRPKGDRVYLGSGHCGWKDWKCFDIVDHPNVSYLKFSPEFVLPLRKNSIELIYSSHNLEHLDNPTVTRLILQSYDKLQSGGKFLLKIPNFSYLIEAYRSGNLSEINDSGVLDVMHTWHNKGVQPTLENKISMVFCGYMDRAYGKHFQDASAGLASGGYHGPAVLPAAELKYLLQNKEISEISECLNQAALSDENFLEFNHQNAWSNDDLIGLFCANGYRCVSSDPYKITKRFYGSIPDIKKFFDQSSYFLFVKP